MRVASLCGSAPSLSVGLWVALEWRLCGLGRDGPLLQGLGCPQVCLTFTERQSCCVIASCPMQWPVRDDTARPCRLCECGLLPPVLQHPLFLLCRQNHLPLGHQNCEWVAAAHSNKSRSSFIIFSIWHSVTCLIIPHPLPRLTRMHLIMHAVYPGSVCPDVLWSPALLQ